MDKKKSMRQELERMLPLLQAEAGKERWRNVRPDNFKIVSNKDREQICLKYTDDTYYEIEFTAGWTLDGFSTPRPDKYVDIAYQMVCETEDSSARVYFENEIAEFVSVAGIILNIAFSWKAIFAETRHGAHITVLRENAFQKFCLFLDILIPFLSEYKPTAPFIPASLIAKKRDLENLLSIDLEISDDQETTPIFATGHYF